MLIKIKILTRELDSHLRVDTNDENGELLKFFSEQARRYDDILSGILEHQGPHETSEAGIYKLKRNINNQYDNYLYYRVVPGQIKYKYDSYGFGRVVGIDIITYEVMPFLSL